MTIPNHHDAFAKILVKFQLRCDESKQVAWKGCEEVWLGKQEVEEAMSELCREQTQ
jgi:hypothetical protein